jgi:hypothetical protein
MREFSKIMKNKYFRRGKFYPRFLIELIVFELINFQLYCFSFGIREPALFNRIVPRPIIWKKRIAND